MSFSSDVKQTVIEAQYRSLCCRRAFLDGVLLAKAAVDGKRSVSVNLEKLEYAEYVSKYVKEIYSKEPKITTPPKGGRCKVVSFSSRTLGVTLAAARDLDRRPFTLKCQGCTAAFLRGVFLACGRMTDPNKSFCLEFSLGNNISVIKNSFDELGLEFKTAIRRTETLLYTKNSTVIEDFFAMADLMSATFAVVNIKFENEQINIANRQTNLDSGNISRAVSAAAAQYELIKELYDRRLFGKLPEELRYTAELRLNNPEMSLAQLAMHSHPPITKSGLIHRMNKIMKLSKELLNVN